MILASFSKQNHYFVKVSVSGHANFADSGEDIVCAAVTSAVQLTANGITEILHQPAQVTVLENEIIIALGDIVSQQASQFLEALHLHLSVLAQEYPNNITITLAEV